MRNKTVRGRVLEKWLRVTATLAWEIGGSHCCKQDARGSYEMVKAKIVTSNFEVKSIMLTCAPTTGKTALEKAKFISKTLEHMANGNARVMEILQSKIQAIGW